MQYLWYDWYICTSSSQMKKNHSIFHNCSLTWNVILKQTTTIRWRTTNAVAAPVNFSAFFLAACFILKIFTSRSTHLAACWLWLAGRLGSLLFGQPEVPEVDALAQHITRTNMCDSTAATCGNHVQVENTGKQHDILNNMTTTYWEVNLPNVWKWHSNTWHQGTRYLTLASFGEDIPQQWLFSFHETWHAKRWKLHKSSVYTKIYAILKYIRQIKTIYAYSIILYIVLRYIHYIIIYHIDSQFCFVWAFAHLVASQSPEGCRRTHVHRGPRRWEGPRDWSRHSNPSAEKSCPDRRWPKVVLSYSKFDAQSLACILICFFGNSKFYFLGVYAKAIQWLKVFFHLQRPTPGLGSVEGGAHEVPELVPQFGLHHGCKKIENTNWKNTCEKSLQLVAN